MKLWSLVGCIVVLGWGLAGCKLGTLGGDPGTTTPDRLLAAPVMLTVSAGEFTMGRPYDTTGLTDATRVAREVPTHEVTLTEYEMAVHETTNAQLAAALNWALDRGYLENAAGDPYDGGEVYVDGRVAYLPRAQGGGRVDFVDGSFVVVADGSVAMGDHPALFVSWYGAVSYCNWLSESRGLTPCYNGSWARVSLGGYRLPTEAEFERAAGWEAPATHWRYGFRSDAIAYASCNYDDAANDPLGVDTTRVGYYDGAGSTIDSASPAGCYDMSGNAMEWCHDWLGDYTSDPVTDPTGPATGTYRLLRGGGWGSVAEYCRTASRYEYSPAGRSAATGFRVARTTGS